MAFTNQSLKPMMGTFGDGVVSVDFSFQMNGASSPTVTSGKGIAGVVRTGTGAYTVTLLGRFVQLLSGQVSIATANGTGVDIVKILNESTSAKLGTTTAPDGSTVSTVKIVCLNDAGAAAEEAAATYSWVNVGLKLSLSALNT